MASSSGPPPSDHDALFYDDNRFLLEAILDFCVRALRAEDPLVLLATRAHTADLAAQLRARGYDWAAAVAAGRAVAHDADAMLERICGEGMPDRARFHAAMHDVLAPWADLSEQHTVRVFGEIVDLLCRAGRHEAAARLEELWNELTRSHRFTLLCAYSMGNLYREVNGSAYRRIRDAHDHVAAPPVTPDSG